MSDRAATTSYSGAICNGWLPTMTIQRGTRYCRSENIARAIEAELWFYGAVLGFEPADEIEPVEIS